MSNEAKTVKSYKVSQEFRDKIEKLFAESGMASQETFIEHLAMQYEMQLLKEGSLLGYKKQLDELDMHARRTTEIYLSMITTEGAERLELIRQHEEKLNERAGVIFSQEQLINDSKKLVKQFEEELAKALKDNSDLTTQLEQVREISSKSNLLVDEYSKQILSLTGLLDENKAAADENKGLKTQLAELTKLTDKQATELLNLKGDLISAKELAVNQAELQKERHAEDLQRFAERKDLEKERELLAVQTKYQAKLEKASEEATEKIRVLYDQLDKMRVVKNKVKEQMSQG